MDVFGPFVFTGHMTGSTLTMTALLDDFPSSDVLEEVSGTFFENAFKGVITSSLFGGLRASRFASFTS